MKTKKGFTLVELLIVIGIIGVLAGMVIAVLNPRHFQAKSRDAKRKADLEQVRSALEMYRADNGNYPAGSGSVASVLTVLQTNGYLTLPTDPGTYDYRYVSAGLTTYQLCAYLEKETGSSACGGGACGGATCNYQVTNP